MIEIEMNIEDLVDFPHGVLIIHKADLSDLS